ncbi:hypothetical protein C8F04DRAFT_1338297 [Mycena alexandri]|uniref:Uncharacterized protein n=1 Tax=Mycena alexandri TaxID=1745969 RepID=A0AAD6T0I3_9AGAR|nr:hypothetical protein C8F04DRAFT_1338297 [Mycena alexandri]
MSSSSYASITALTVLENPRATTPKGLVFDGHFYLGGETRHSIMGSLRYFNKSDTEFAPVRLYFAYITVAQLDPLSSVELFIDPDSKTKCEDYTFVSDIHCSTSATRITQALIQTNVPMFTSVVSLSIPMWTATFAVDADQYTSAMRNAQKEAKSNNKPLPKSFFLTSCTIRDSPRYEHVKQPVPFNTYYMMLAAYLTDITSSLSGNTVTDTFCVDIENICFLGSATGGTTITPVASTPSSSSSGGSCKGWNYSTTPRNNDNDSNKRLRLDQPASSSPAGPSSSPSPAGSHA